MIKGQLNIFKYSPYGQEGGIIMLKITINKDKGIFEFDIVMGHKDE